jgi:hypothetical protein
MSGEGAKNKCHVTPLMIISTFLGLAEVVLGYTITNTLGWIQVALVIYFIVFTIVIFSFLMFFLWKKPQNLYSPRDYEGDIDIDKYINTIKGVSYDAIEEIQSIKSDALKLFQEVEETKNKINIIVSDFNKKIEEAKRDAKKYALIFG